MLLCGAPRNGRAQRRATLSPAQRRLLNSVQGREGSKGMRKALIQDKSDEYGYRPGCNDDGAKGGMS